MTAIATAAPAVNGQRNLTTNIGFCQTPGLMHDSRSSAASALISTNSAPQIQDAGLILVTGGVNGSSPTSISNTADLYDASTGLFTPTGHTMLAHRAGHTATALGSGQVLIAGGYDDLTHHHLSPSSPTSEI